MRWSLDEVVAAVDGCLLSVPPEGSVLIDRVSQDSRQCGPGTLFVPLVGERDGHDFIEDAVRAGACAYFTAEGPRSVVATEAAHSGLTAATRAAHSGQAAATRRAAAIGVDDTQQALIALARAARARLGSIPVVGITGSVGKTTTKDLLAAVLGRNRRVHASARSFNNEIGVPLTLLAAPEDTEAVVLEMGSRGIGQIRELCDIALPTAGVVTTVGLAHTSEFGSLGAVAVAKRELVESLPGAADGGIAFINVGVPEVAEMAAHTSARIVSYGIFDDTNPTNPDAPVGANSTNTASPAGANSAATVGTNPSNPDASIATNSRNPAEPVATFSTSTSPTMPDVTPGGLIARPDVTAHKITLDHQLRPHFTLISHLDPASLLEASGALGVPAAPRDPTASGALGVPAAHGAPRAPGALRVSGKIEVVLGARGRHAVDNALAAAAVGLALGVPLADVAAGLAQPVLSPLRMELLRLRSGARVINDCYNANPMSMRAALQSLAALGCERRLAVLGVMAELGDYEATEHAAITAAAADLGVQVIAVNAPQYAFGQARFAHARSGQIRSGQARSGQARSGQIRSGQARSGQIRSAQAVRSPSTVINVSGIEAAVDALERLGGLDSDSAVLVKGSRVAGLEALVDQLVGRDRQDV